MELFGFTASEAAIAAGIAAGLDLGQLADARGVAIGTVRWQLKRVFAKTGVSRQCDLVRLCLLCLSTHESSSANTPSGGIPAGRSELNSSRNRGMRPGLR